MRIPNFNGAPNVLKVFINTPDYLESTEFSSAKAMQAGAKPSISRFSRNIVKSCGWPEKRWHPPGRRLGCFVHDTIVEDHAGDDLAYLLVSV